MLYVTAYLNSTSTCTFNSFLNSYNNRYRIPFGYFFLLQKRQNEKNSEINQLK